MNTIRNWSLIIMMLMGGHTAAAGKLLSPDSTTSANEKSALCQEPLHIMCADNYPPYEFVNEEGKPDGFDIKVMELVMQRLNLKYEWVVFNCADAADSIQKKAVDLALRTPYNKNEKSIYECGPVYATTWRVIITKNKENLNSIESLSNKRVGVCSGSIAHSLITEMKKNFHLRCYCNYDELFHSLSNDCSDAVICDYNTLAYFQKSNPDYAKFHTSDSLFMKHNFQAVTYKGNKPLIQTIDSVYNEVKTTQEYRMLEAQWLSKPNPTIKSFTESISRWLFFNTWNVVITLLILFVCFFFVVRYFIVRKFRKMDRRISLNQDKEKEEDPYSSYCKAGQTDPTQNNTNQWVNAPSISTRLPLKRTDKPMHILVAEDDECNFMLFTVLLKDCIIDRAANGLEAVNMAHENHYDAILMDIKMPVLDGLQATRSIRSFNNSVPIVAITANIFDSAKEQAKQAGYDEFLTKPLRRQELEQVLFGEVTVVNTSDSQQ